MVDEYRVYAYNFEDENKKEALYWRDVGTLEAYYEANMDMVAVSPVFNLYDADWPIRNAPATVSTGQVCVCRGGPHGTAVDSIISRVALCPRHGEGVHSFTNVRVNSLFRNRGQHFVSRCEYWPALQDPKAIIDRGCAHPGGHDDRLRYRRG